MSSNLRLALMASPTTLGVTAGAVALASMQSEFGLSSIDASVLVVFTVGVAVGTPVAGRIELVYGGRVTLWTAVMAAVVGGLLTLIGPSNDVVLAGRFALGAASGVFTTLAFVGAGRHERPPAAFAAVSAVMNGLAGAGALLGAILTSAGLWRLTLLLPALVLLVAPFALRAEPPRSKPAESARLDGVGMALLAVLVMAAVTALDGPSARLSTRTSGVLALIALLSGALLIARSRRIGSRGFVPVRAFADPGYRRALAVGPFFMAANFSTLFLVPVLLQQRGATAYHVGLMALPAMAVAMVSGLAAARARCASRTHQMMGVSGLAVFVVLLAAALTRDEIFFGAAMAAVLGATALSQGTISTSATRMLRPEDRSGALGLFNLTLQVGGAAGVAVVALLAARSSELALTASAAFGLIAGVLGVWLLRPSDSTPAQVAVLGGLPGPEPRDLVECG